jgi:hypothetical protein
MQFFIIWVKSHPAPYPTPVGSFNPTPTFLETYASIVEILVAVAIIGTECIANRQTDKYSSLYI